MRNSGTVWTVTNRSAPRCAAKGALHVGVNISVCENNSKWSVFSDSVTYNMYMSVLKLAVRVAYTHGESVSVLKLLLLLHRRLLGAGSRSLPQLGGPALTRLPRRLFLAAPLREHPRRRAATLPQSRHRSAKASEEAELHPPPQAQQQSDGGRRRTGCLQGRH